MIKELTSLKKFDKVIDIRVLGAIGVVQFNTNWKEILYLREYFNKNGVWLRPFSDVIYIMPPLTISEEELLKITETIFLALNNLLFFLSCLLNVLPKDFLLSGFHVNRVKWSFKNPKWRRIFSTFTVYDLQRI